jgi:hypothetical protein
MTCDLECAVMVFLILVFSIYIAAVVNRTFNAKS